MWLPLSLLFLGLIVLLNLLGHIYNRCGACLYVAESQIIHHVSGEEGSPEE